MLLGRLRRKCCFQGSKPLLEESVLLSQPQELVLLAAEALVLRQGIERQLLNLFQQTHLELAEVEPFFLHLASVRYIGKVLLLCDVLPQLL